MRFHRFVALASATVLVGLLGVAAEASNFSSPKAKDTKVMIQSTLREKIKNADIEGCGG